MQLWDIDLVKGLCDFKHVELGKNVEGVPDKGLLKHEGLRKRLCDLKRVELGKNEVGLKDLHLDNLEVVPVGRKGDGLTLQLSSTPTASKVRCNLSALKVLVKDKGLDKHVAPSASAGSWLSCLIPPPSGRHFSHLLSSLCLSLLGHLWDRLVSLTACASSP